MGKSYVITEAERERRSRQAKRQHEEGTFGGPEFGRLGGRKKADNLLTHTVTELRKPENRTMIVNRLLDIIENGRDREAVGAIKSALAYDIKEYEVSRKEDRELEQLEQAELIAHVVDGLRGLYESGRLDGDLVIDGDGLVEVRAIEAGESD